jgi:hypothetical protein
VQRIKQITAFIMGILLNFVAFCYKNICCIHHGNLLYSMFCNDKGNAFKEERSV